MDDCIILAGIRTRIKTRGVAESLKARQNMWRSEHVCQDSRGYGGLETLGRQQEGILTLVLMLFNISISIPVDRP